MIELKGFENRMIEQILGASRYEKIKEEVGLAVETRESNGYAIAIDFKKPFLETEKSLRERVGGDYYLKHPTRDEFVEVSVDLVDGFLDAMEIVPLGGEELPSDIEDFVLIARSG